MGMLTTEQVMLPMDEFSGTAYGLLLLAGLIALRMYFDWKGKTRAPCPYAKEIASLHKKLDDLVEDHGPKGDHHKALERTERRVMALLRANDVADPDGRF